MYIYIYIYSRFMYSVVSENKENFTSLLVVFVSYID